MSDEEDVVYVKKQKTIHYGSLEEAMIKQLRSEAAETGSSATATTTNSAKLTDNVPEYFDIDAEV